MSKKALFVNALTFARVPLIFLWAVFAVWQEFEDQSTPEARLSKEVDRLEMGVQAVVYENACAAADLSDFLASTRRALSSPALHAFLDALESLRPSPRRP